MINAHFVILGALLSPVGVALYLREMLRGQARPHRISWSLWALAPLLAFAIEIKHGVGLAALMTFTVGFGPAVIFAASLALRRGDWQWTRLDVLCGALSLLGLILWLAAGQTDLGIGFAIASDALAAVPTLLKAWREPKSEVTVTFALAAVNATVTLLTLTRWDMKHLGFPLYILAVNILLVVLLRAPRRRTAQPQLC